MAKIILDQRKEKSKMITRKIKSKAELYGVHYERLAAAAGVCLKTFYSRINAPESFTYKELYGIAETLHTTVAYLVSEELESA